MILAIVFAVLAYQKANNTGRNGIIWAIVAVFAFIGTQLLAGFAIGLILVFGSLTFGWSETLIDDYSMLLNFGGIIVGIGCASLVIWYLGKAPYTEYENDEPPPPPKFDGS